MPSQTTEPSRERERICQALTELVAEHGYPELTADSLQERAGVDRETFERYFTSLEDCFGTVWDDANAELDRRLLAAFSAPGPWRDRIRAAIAAELRFLSEDQARARMYLFGALFGGEGLRARRQVAMQRLIAMIDLGREEAEGSRAPTQSVAVGIAGAIWHHVQRVLTSRPGAELEAELPELMYMVVLPYLGSKAAREELRRPPQ